jgi:hypothetical protein
MVQFSPRLFPPASGVITSEVALRSRYPSAGKSHTFCNRKFTCISQILNLINLINTSPTVLCFQRGTDSLFCHLRPLLSINSLSTGELIIFLRIIICILRCVYIFNLLLSVDVTSKFQLSLLIIYFFTT